MSRSGIEDLEPLKKLKIEVLDISETRIEDLTPLKGMSIKALRIFDCPVRDFSPLAKCKSLKVLDPPDNWRRIPGKEYMADKPIRFPPSLFEPRKANPKERN